MKFKLNLCMKRYVSSQSAYQVSGCQETYPALGVLVWMVLLCQPEVSLPDFALIESKGRKATQL